MKQHGSSYCWHNSHNGDGIHTRQNNQLQTQLIILKGPWMTHSIWMTLLKTWSSNFQHNFTIQYYDHFQFRSIVQVPLLVWHEDCKTIFNLGLQLFKLHDSSSQKDCDHFQFMFTILIPNIECNCKIIQFWKLQATHTCSKISFMISKVYLKLIVKCFT
jgi:hypothetical protein